VFHCSRSQKCHFVQRCANDRCVLVICSFCTRILILVTCMVVCVYCRLNIHHLHWFCGTFVHTCITGICWHHSDDSVARCVYFVRFRYYIYLPIELLQLSLRENLARCMPSSCVRLCGVCVAYRRLSDWTRLQ